MGQEEGVLIKMGWGMGTHPMCYCSPLTTLQNSTGLITRDKQDILCKNNTIQ
jgi:hypothetical protein